MSMFEYCLDGAEFIKIAKKKKINIKNEQVISILDKHGLLENSSSYKEIINSRKLITIGALKEIAELINVDWTSIILNIRCDIKEPKIAYSDRTDEYKKKHMFHGNGDREETLLSK